MTEDRIAILRRALTEQEDDTDFQLKERLKAEEALALTKEALRQSLTSSGVAWAALDRIRVLHQPVDVATIPGAVYLTAFTRCSCTPRLLYDECPTAQVLAEVTR